MQLALYAEGVGYYTSGAERVGHGGKDFYTSVSGSNAFGAVLAHYAAKVAEEAGEETCVVIEQGANSGKLASDLISAFPRQRPISYIIVEPSAANRQRQEKTLRQVINKVTFVNSLEELEPQSGVFLANELLDAFPFHLAEYAEAGWQELFVTEENGAFEFVSGSPSSQISEMIAKLPVRDVGTKVELRPAAAEWLSAAARKIRSGRIVTIDYGGNREWILDPCRVEGTFSCYSQHRRDNRPLEDPGGKDITAHVNFSDLMDRAREAGLTVIEYTDQHHFLVEAAKPLLADLDGQPGHPTLRGLIPLLHPESMGRAFKVLVLEPQRHASNNM